MNVNGIITLTTDFGTMEPYAGIMKGMILTSNPDARIVDLTHEIPAHDVVNASFMLVRTYMHFPGGTIHIAVIDPGVGGERKNIAVLTTNFIFIGPDNGIFTLVLTKEKIVEIREIRRPPFLLKKVSDTFHGRDVYAPCAGHLSAGKNFFDIGPEIKHLKRLEYPRISQEGNELKGEIVSIDSFGNMITNITVPALQRFAGKRRLEIYFGAERFFKIMHRYTDVSPGMPLVLYGSSGYLEVSMNEGRASSYFMTSVGSTITIRRF